MEYEERHCQYQHCKTPFQKLPTVGMARKNGDIFFDSPKRKYHLKCYKELMKERQQQQEWINNAKNLFQGAY